MVGDTARYTNELFCVLEELLPAANALATKARRSEVQEEPVSG
jgi:hypothetical protein